jgi:Holliday junction DNA helicase RuvB
MDNKILTTIIDKFKGGPVGFVYFGWPYQKVVKLFEVWAIPDSEGFYYETPRGRE